MIKKFSLLTLIIFALTFTSCANRVHVNHIKSWPRVIEESMETTATIRVMQKNALTFCISTQPGDCDDEIPAYKTVALGTGFVISKDGQVVTNFHVIFPQVAEPGTQFWVEFTNGKRYLVKQTYSFPLYDLAILKIEAKGLPTVRLEAGKPLKQGEPLVSAGYQYRTDMEGSIAFSEGMVSSVSCCRPSGTFLQYSWALTTIQIYPGFSGGPVFNKYGNVVGVNNAVFTRRPGFGLIIPVEYLRRVLKNGLVADSKKKLTEIAELYEKLDPKD